MCENALLLIIEGIVMCFVLLIVCVIGIANGPVGLVVFYEDDVQKRVVELGYTTKEKNQEKLHYHLHCAVLAACCVYAADGLWD